MSRRELSVAALLCAAGAGLALLAAGRPWATVRAEEAITPFSRSLTGNELAGQTAAFGWAALAGLAALFAVRGAARGVVAVLLLGSGIGIGSFSALAVSHGAVVADARDKYALIGAATVAVDVSAWWMVSLAGGVLLALAGLLTLVRGHRWPGLSARYDRPGTGAKRPAEEAHPAELWKSLDRGEDPTLRSNGTGS